jgi:uncharacterized protein (DUF4213/DUF364 family)
VPSYINKRPDALPIKNELLSLVTVIDRQLKLPPVSRAYIPEPRPHEHEHTEFGVIVLEGGAAGLYYAWLGEQQRGMRKRFPEKTLVGRSPAVLAKQFESSDEATCSLGLAAINAVTQWLFRQSGFSPDTAGNSMGELDVLPGDHVGMVGYFASLVRQLQERNIHVTVIEKKSQFLGKQDHVNVTLDPGELENCNKILCTAATLLNDSMDNILQYTQHAERLVVVGPTAGFFPDPLFRRGVTAVGGTEILDGDLSIENLKHDKGLKNCSRKYTIYGDTYPGTETLLNRLI